MAKRPVTRILLFLLPVLAAVVAFKLIVGEKTPPTLRPPQERARSVRVITVPVVDFVPQASGFGTIQPELVWEAVAEVEGRIVATHPELKRGALVPEGDMLVRIDPALRLTATQRSEAEVERLLASVDELAQTEANLRRQLAVEEQALAISQRELTRRQQLIDQGVIAATELDQEQQRFLSQKNAVQNLENNLALIPAQRQELLAQLAQSRSQLDDARINLEKTEINAPFDGRLRAVRVELGEAVTPGQVLAELDSIGVAEALAEIPMHVMRRVIPRGAPPFADGVSMRNLRRFFSLDAVVRLTIGDKRIEWAGRMVRIREEVDPQSRTVGVYVAVNNSYLTAVPGERPPLMRNTYCEVVLKGQPRPGTVVVPRSAVRQGVVLVVNDANRLTRVPVEVDLTQENLAVIASGISGGERVVVSDVPYAIDGMLLDPMEDSLLAASLVREAEATSPQLPTPLSSPDAPSAPGEPSPATESGIDSDTESTNGTQP